MTRRQFLVAVAVVLAVPAIWLVARGFAVYRVAQDDPLQECAAEDEEHKDELLDIEWRWLPPRWDCVYEDPAIDHAVP